MRNIPSTDVDIAVNVAVGKVTIVAFIGLKLSNGSHIGFNITPTCLNRVGTVDYMDSMNLSIIVDLLSSEMLDILSFSVNCVQMLSPLMDSAL